jgi:hypothetical protein
MERKTWLQLIVSALSLVLSLVLDLHYPHLKNLVCTDLPNLDRNDPSSGSMNLNQAQTERIK